MRGLLRRLAHPLECRYRRRVDRGARLLDAKRPDWYDRVNLLTLDMGSRGYCVVGQLYGNYGLGILAVLRVDGRQHGFNAVSWRFSLLDRLWTREVQDRRLRDLEMKFAETEEELR